MEETTPLICNSTNSVNQYKYSWLAYHKVRFACGAILVTEMLERIAFYGLVGNLVMFLNQNPLYWCSYQASTALFVFTGFSYMTSFFGGWLSDAYLGKFKSIVLFFIIYLSGYAVMPFFTTGPNQNSTNTLLKCDNHSSGDTVTVFNDLYDRNVSSWMAYGANANCDGASCFWLIYLVLMIVGVGNGGIKANIAPFGADQIKHEGPHSTRIFFNWFYWCINLGALISIGGLGYVQQNVSFFWGFVASNASLVLACIAFLIGGVAYIKKPAGGSILTNVCKILKESCCSRDSRNRSMSRSFSDNSSAEQTSGTPSRLDLAKISFGGSFHDNMVEDVKTLGKIVLVFISLVPYWIVYFQMETTFVIQGLHMRLDFDNENSSVQNKTHEAPFKIVASWLSLFDIVFLIILIPVMDRVVYPMFDRRGINLSLRVRILTGMVFSVMAVCAAGTLELFRLQTIWTDWPRHIYRQKIGKSTYFAADMTILWQIPQYTLIGISEVFASVAGLELAYVQAPKSMHGIIMGLFYCFSQGMGSMLGSLIISAFKGIWFFEWDFGDINCHKIPCKTGVCYCHLDYYFFFLAGLQAVGILIFVLTAWYLGMGAVSTSYETRYDGPVNRGLLDSEPRRSRRHHRIDST